MGVSYKKSIRLSKNTRVNISKNGGIGFSTGFKGFRISKNNKGTRLTIGKDGVYYTKFLGKKKSRTKTKTKEKNPKIVKDNLKENKIVKPLNLETDFEAVPNTIEDILLYLGGKATDYLFFVLFGLTLISAILFFIYRGYLYGIILSVLIGVTLFYIFLSKHNNFINDLNRSIKLFDNGKFSKGYKLLEKCLNTMPKNKKARLLMIFTAFRLDKYHETLTFISEYKKSHEPYEVIYFIEAVCLTEVGKYMEAITAIEKVYSTELEIKYSKYKIIGDCYLGLGEVKKAIKWYELLSLNGVNIDDNIKSYKYAIGKALYLDGNHKKAFKYLSDVYDYNPNYKDVRSLLNCLETVS